MADETKNPQNDPSPTPATTGDVKPVKAKDEAAEAKAESDGKPVALVDVVEEKALPSVKDAKVNVLPQEDKDPNEGWTVQSVEGDEPRTFLDRDSLPGQYVAPHELPTREGLKDIGVEDVPAYLANVPVKA